MRREVLSDMRARLQAAFGERLKGVVLYGSQARGDASEDSDVDLLVLLDEPIRLGRDLETIVGALYGVQLQIDEPIHALPVSVHSYDSGSWALYRNAQQEGVRV